MILDLINFPLVSPIPLLFWEDCHDKSHFSTSTDDKPRHPSRVSQAPASELRYTPAHHFFPFNSKINYLAVYQNSPPNTPAKAVVEK